MMKIKLIALFVFFALALNAQNVQDKKYHSSVFLGLGTPILDNGLVIQASYNPVIDIAKHLSIEGQASIASINGEAFLTGESVNTVSTSALGGLRYYILSEEKKYRPFINLMTGSTYQSNEFLLGFSTGAYLQVNKYQLGISYDTHNLLLKAGIIF